jgi:hypothetical protein
MTLIEILIKEVRVNSVMSSKFGRLIIQTNGMHTAIRGNTKATDLLPVVSSANMEKRKDSAMLFNIHMRLRTVSARCAE